MEEQKSIALLITIGSVFIVLLILLFVIFIISQKRKQHSLKTIIEIMKARNSSEYSKIKAENEKIKQDLAKLKKEVFGKENEA